MEVFIEALKAIPRAAGDWLSVLALVVCVIAWSVAYVRVARNRRLLAKIEAIPERDRAEVLKVDMGGVNLPARMAASELLLLQGQRLLVVAILSAIAAIVALVAASMMTSLLPPAEGTSPAPVDRCRDLAAGPSKSSVFSELVRWEPTGHVAAIAKDAKV